jgi:Na+-transporting methylmalonyl-CoA/oxaloacetate decarboxylase gamma subunit
MNAITSALLITLVGMSLVFIAILILWGLMALMVRLTSGEAKEDEMEILEPEPVEAPGIEIKLRAAAAAAAIALAMEGGASLKNQTNFSQSSSWLSVMRAHQLDLRTSLISRKQRGSTR